VTAPTPSPIATRAVVADHPGASTTLTRYDDAGALGCIVLGPADALSLAHDLLGAARIRYGRLPQDQGGDR
jgi:hypothetical protein